MSFRDVKSAADAAEYIARLNRNRPERAKVLDLILAQIQQLDALQPRVLELCCGAGVLGAHLLNGAPGIVYTGIDQSQPLLDAAEESLAEFAERVTLLRRDLNADAWHEAFAEDAQKFDAIVSMQSLHDLGGEAEVSRIYELAYGLLRADGIFVNADLINRELIVETDGELADNPGRFTVAKHLGLLNRYGFRDASCVAQPGGFGVILGRCN